MHKLSYCETLELVGKCAAKGIISKTEASMLRTASEVMEDFGLQKLLRRVYSEEVRRNFLHTA